MKRGMRKVLGIVLTMLLILNLASAASAYVAPTFLETTLIAGSSTDEIKLVTFDKLTLFLRLT